MMIKKLLFMLVGILVLALTVPALAEKADDYTKTINKFKGSKSVQWFFNNNYGYAVFPTIGKAGFIVGGSYGKGQVYRSNKPTGRIKVVEGSLGLTLGAKAFSQIIFFENKAAYELFTSGSFEMSANAEATVLSAGAEAKAGTTGASAGASAVPGVGAQAKTKYLNSMAIFVQSLGGLMGELSVSGQKFTFKPF